MSRSELSNELVLAFQYVDDRYLDIAEEETALRTRRFFEKLVSPMAACIVGLILLLALPIAAIAANWFGLRDLLLPVKPHIPPLKYETPLKDFIGLSGFQESAEAQALGEWREFLDEYDPDQKIIGEIGNAWTGFEEKYGQYNVYTQEMADKLEEIVQKYNLKLHTEMIVIDNNELADYVGGEFLGKDIDISDGLPYLYENGTLNFEGDAMYGESGSISFQCRRSVKGTFDEVVLHIGNIDEYQEFQYISACGEPVILALSAGKSLIFADFDQCFILLNILEGSETGITEEILKEIADEFDFTVLKDVRKPDMESQKVTGSVGQESQFAGDLPAETDGAGSQSEEYASDEKLGGIVSEQDENALSDMREKYKAILLGEEDFVRIDRRDGYRSLNIGNIKEVVSDEDWVTAEVTKFAIVDLDGNGAEELVLWIQANGTLNYGFEILYYHDQEIYGFTLVDKQLWNLKTDGTFEASGAAYAGLVFRLELYERGYVIEEVFGSGHQSKKPDVEWHDLTEDNVEEHL